MRRETLICILGTLILAVGGSAGCTGTNASTSPQAQPTAGTPAPQKAGGNQGQAPQKGGATGGGTAKVVNTAAVTPGDVKLTFTYSGTLESGSQVSIVPKTSGRLETLLVDVGSQVKAGDTVAIMERTTLQLSVQQAQANLKSAQAKLATVMTGGRPEDVASAQAAVDSAQAKLATVMAGGRPEDVASAQAAQDSAQAKLDALMNPSPSDIQTAQTTLDKARADLTSNSAALDKLKNGATPDVWATAQKDVDNYAAAIKSAQVALDQKKAGNTTADLAAQQAAVDQAKQALTSAEDKYQTAKGVDSKGNSSLAASGFSSVSAALQSYNTAKAAYDAAVQKQQQMQGGFLPADMQSAQATLDQAQANYNAAVAKIEQMKKGPLPQDVQAAQSLMDKSKSDVAAAEVKLAQLKSPTDYDIATSQATVTQAQQALALKQQPYTEQDVQSAQAAVTQAQQALALKQQPYTLQDVQSAQAAVDVAQAALDSSKSALADATLVTPFDGVVTQKLLSPGALVSPSSPIVTVFSKDLSIPISVEESRLDRLKPDLSTSITVPSYPGESFSGKVTSISPSADSKSHTFVMRVAPDDSSDRLKAGMFAEVVVTAEQRSNALLVSRDAVVQRNGKDVVFVVAGGKAQLRPVVQGIPTDGMVEIIDGLKKDEQVVVVGLSGLNDGDAVRVLPSTSGQPSGQPQPQGQDAPSKTN